jgi:hypothetical protein
MVRGPTRIDPTEIKAIIKAVGCKKTTRRYRMASRPFGHFGILLGNGFDIVPDAVVDSQNPFDSRQVQSVQVRKRKRQSMRDNNYAAENGMLVWKREARRTRKEVEVGGHGVGCAFYSGVESLLRRGVGREGAVDLGSSCE